MNIRHFLRYILLFAALLTLTGCAGRSEPPIPDGFSDFRCEVKGRIHRTELVAVIESDGERITLSYLSPAGMEGLTAERRDGTWQVISGTYTLADERCAAALLLPALILTGEHGMPQSIQKDGDGNTVRRYADGSYITVDADGTPGVCGNASSEWYIAWWEE